MAETGSESRATALTVGNFDGVHLGHVALVEAARAAVGPSPGGRVAVLSFDPHPISVLRPDETPARLSRWDQRAQWLKEAGADHIEALVPTRDFLSQSPRAFIERIVEAHRPAVIVEGPDFRFGARRAGSVATLVELERAFGYRTVVIEQACAALTDQSIVAASSTMIRWLLARGRVHDAQRLLGRPYELRAPVVRGDQRGRTLGFPTANLDHGDQLLPADGIYAGEGEMPDGRIYPAAISVGVKPTFHGRQRVCEAYLIGYDGDAGVGEYGWTLSLRFHRWLRDQLMYTEVRLLIEQLHRDVREATSWSANA